MLKKVIFQRSPSEAFFFFWELSNQLGVKIITESSQTKLLSEKNVHERVREKERNTYAMQYVNVTWENIYSLAHRQILSLKNFPQPKRKNHFTSILRLDIFTISRSMIRVSLVTKLLRWQKYEEIVFLAWIRVRVRIKSSAINNKMS